jgi:protein-S-isoprenylcysteine O-methyltransferase Ste14
VADLDCKWVISGFFVKNPARSEPAPSRVTHLALFGLGIGLIYARGIELGMLERHFLVPSVVLDAVSVLLTIVGLVLASWARVHIGQYWSASVTLKTGHRIIQTGPYAYMRHPIYTGILTAFLGALLVNGQYRGVIGFAVLVAAILFKARR